MVPIVTGRLYDDRVQSPVYVCASDGDTLYGSYGSNGQPFTAHYKDGVATGVLYTPQENQTFTWVYDFSTWQVSAAYQSPQCALSFFSQLTFISSIASESQCKGKVVVSAYTGVWTTDTNNTLYLCVSGNQVYGSFNNIKIASTFTDDGSIIGHYNLTHDLSQSGYFMANVTLDEQTLYMVTDSSSMTFNKLSIVASSETCMDWGSFWVGRKYGRNYARAGTLHQEFTGCFSVCLNDT